MKRGRLVLSGVLVVALLLTGFLRSQVQQRRDAIIPRPRGESRLSAMNTFTLGLLLGGLRGPLVMMLWTSSENQKIEKNLEDIDTKINLIKLLQPEFDSVHIFQSWNKAYNLSVMLANRSSKYAAVLDALDYDHSVDAERPDNVNIIECMAGIYFNKLGNAVGPMTDRRFYSDRMRLETLPKAKASSARKGQSGWRRTQHDTLLDSHGFLLPELLAPRPNAVGHPRQYTGAELQFLDYFNTPEAGGFPYGVSPLALSYNYYKRCAILESLTGQKHVYMSDSMMDSRPAVTLNYWAQDEWVLGRLLEARILGNNVVPDECLDLEMSTAPLSQKDLAPPTDALRKMVAEAIFHYRRTALISRLALAEYDRHVKNPLYTEDISMYASHIDAMRATGFMMEGDADYLAALAAKAGFTPPLGNKDEVARLLASAADSYQKTLNAYYLSILKFYVDERVAALVYPKPPAGTMTKGQDPRRVILTTDPKLFPSIYQAVQATLATDPKGKKYDLHRDDTQDAELYIRRATARMAQIRQMQ